MSKCDKINGEEQVRLKNMLEVIVRKEQQMLLKNLLKAIVIYLFLSAVAILCVLDLQYLGYI